MILLSFVVVAILLFIVYIHRVHVYVCILNIQFDRGKEFLFFDFLNHKFIQKLEKKYAPALVNYGQSCFV